MDYIRYSSYLTRFLLYEKLLCTFYVLQNQVSHRSQFDDDAEKNSQISFGDSQLTHLIIAHFFKKINSKKFLFRATRINSNYLS